jgi:hypothetical protein
METVRRRAPEATRATPSPAALAFSLRSGLKSIRRAFRPWRPTAAQCLIETDDRQQPGKLVLGQQIFSLK